MLINSSGSIEFMSKLTIALFLTLSAWWVGKNLY